MLVGVDLGTSGMKAALYEPDGTALAEHVEPTPLRWSGTGRVDQDPEGFYAAATTAIAACVRQGGDAVEAIAICGQMAGTMGVDRELEPTTPYDSWLDMRCADEVAWLERELGDALVETSGCPAMVNHAPKILWWLRHEPGVFERTAAWVPPGSYVAARLTGSEPFVDATYLHFTGLADQREGRWSPSLAGAMDVPVERLPRIVAGRRRRAAGPAARHRRHGGDPRRQRRRVPPRRRRPHADHHARRGPGPVGLARVPVGRRAARLARRAAARARVRRA
jgi:xylulokinase